MPCIIPDNDAMNFARLIIETIIIILIALEPVKNVYLQKFVKCLLAAFIFGQLVLITKGTFIYFNTGDEWIMVAWRIYEIIRIFISLSMCYQYLYIWNKVNKNYNDFSFLFVA
jgi:hypothetical protein